MLNQLNIFGRGLVLVSFVEGDQTPDLGASRARASGFSSR